MKTVVKQVLVLAALMLAVPAMAAEGPTKGTKSYQSARAEKPADQTQASTETPATAQEAANMAPAAGDTALTEEKADEGKTMREEMRLPRKN